MGVSKGVRTCPEDIDLLAELSSNILNCFSGPGVFGVPTKLLSSYILKPSPVAGAHDLLDWEILLSSNILKGEAPALGCATTGGLVAVL
jgi:hypothetical protein